MDIQDIWEKSLNNTQIVRPRVAPLLTSDATSVSYIFLAESKVNPGDTVVRRGQIIVEKPSIILPFNLPQFEGFDFEKEFNIGEEMFTNFLLVRGISFPSLKYGNKTHSLDIYEGDLKRAIKFYRDRLQREEDVHTGLIVGCEDCWQFSALIFVCTQVLKSAGNDLKKLFDEFDKKNYLQ